MKTLEAIDYFKRHGYLLGQNKKRYYLVRGTAREDFDTIQQALKYVQRQEHDFIQFRRQQELNGEN